MNFAITRNRTFISTGFDTCAFMPASSVFCLSSSKAFAVMATIGTAALESPNLFRLLCFPYLYVLWKILQKYVEDSLHSSQFQYLQLQSYMQYNFPCQTESPWYLWWSYHLPEYISVNFHSQFGLSPAHNWLAITKIHWNFWSCFIVSLFYVNPSAFSRFHIWSGFLWVCFHQSASQCVHSFRKPGIYAVSYTHLTLPTNSLV